MLPLSPDGDLNSPSIVTDTNVVRHVYKDLAPLEKGQMKHIKDLGLECIAYLDTLGSTRELSIAKTKVQEFVFWAVNGITG